ncbi:hypothetical protein FTO68_03675 [Methanocalculus taiwanensis]|uniref:Uncharacterized protein n=1 Tax=Methanocalculus taiwanensis TaxID=106207 RepID=A0ABD4THW9_9EURY|nr:hypothetical protein [Methanocalculus taiwanensis]MCQ1538091.1 hypothetical protein [Methanocalculus taiwanensis]
MRLKWETKLGIALLCSTAIIYGLKFLIIGDEGGSNTLTYIFNALGFLPVNVLLVTLILNQLLAMRSKREKLQKMNMVIGIFFSEVGATLLRHFSDADPNLDEFRGNLLIRDSWTDAEFDRIREQLRGTEHTVMIQRINLQDLRDFLIQNRDFLLRLLENPVLLEHATFTEALRAVFHLSEELESRNDISNLPETDIVHLTNDIRRVYDKLTPEWVEYMRYLKSHYPYLFSLAMRKNPFDEEANPVIAG